MADPRIKTIKIQTGVLRRLTKEKVSYEKEVDIQRAKIEKYKEEGKDDCYINKQGEVLQESVSMVHDCQRRLAKAFKEFQNIIDSESDLKEAEEYIAAVQILEEAKPHLPN
ncbi:tubulin-specific chaperone A-like [Rhodnius prolixus]